MNKTFLYYLFSCSCATLFVFTRVWPSDHPQIIKNLKTSLSPTEERHDENKFERSTPQNLQNKIIFNCVCYFGMRDLETYQ